MILQLFRMWSPLTVVLALGYLFVTRDQMPPISAPSAKLPSPNAFDDYVQAADQMVEADQVSEIRSDETSPDYLDPTLLQQHRLDLAAANRQALRTMRRGFAHQCLDHWVPPSSRSPVASRLHRLASLVVVDAHARAGSGDFIGAASDGLDLVRYGIDLEQCRDYVLRAVGTTAQRDGQKLIEQAVPELDGPARRRVAAWLSRNLDRRPGRALFLAQIKTGAEQALVSIVTQHCWRWRLAQDEQKGADTAVWLMKAMNVGGSHEKISVFWRVWIRLQFRTSGGELHRLRSLLEPLNSTQGSAGTLPAIEFEGLLPSEMLSEIAWSVVKGYDGLSAGYQHLFASLNQGSRAD